jgi:hypothetical protein
MKKLVYASIAVVAIAISSCSNENSVNPRPVDQVISKATVTGIVRAELNNTIPSPSLGGSFANAEFIPALLAPKVVASINTRDLVLSPASGVTYARKFFEATVGADGSYSFEVEIGPKGSIDVELTYSNFRSDVILSASTTDKGVIFNGGTQTVTVTKGRNEIAPNYLY